MAARATQLALLVDQLMTALRTPVPMFAGNVFVGWRGTGIGSATVVLAFRSDIGCDSVIASFQIFLQFVSIFPQQTFRQRGQFGFFTVGPPDKPAIVERFQDDAAVEPRSVFTRSPGFIPPLRTNFRRMLTMLSRSSTPVMKWATADAASLRR